MTLPYERYRAVNYARDFLGDLLDPKKTPRVPKEIRMEALRILRHYPFEHDMDCAAEAAPDIFGKTNTWIGLQDTNRTAGQ